MSTLPHIATETDAQHQVADALKRGTEIQKLKATIDKLEAQVDTLTARTKKLERTIRVFTTSKTPQAQRAELNGLLTGVRTGRVDLTRGFDKSQLLLLDRFNAMSGTNRRMATLLFKALAEKGT